MTDIEPTSTPDTAPRRQRRLPDAAGAAPRRAAVTRPKRGGITEVSDLKSWLASLAVGVNPAVHVNGAAFASCVLTVDFGSPRKPVKLTAEQSGELVSRIRSATRALAGREVKVGVMNDHSTGIWWTTISG